MTALRIVLCDDEPLALARLRSLLSRIPDLDIVAAAATGGDVIDAIATLRPDLVLLDIEMPDMDGFDVVESIGGLRALGPDAPLIAFVTAFRRFAPQAFDNGAIDFLSKPVRLSRLTVTIERARAAVAAREARQRLRELQNMLDALRGDHDQFRDAHVWVHRRGENVRVNLDKVDRVAAEGAYVRLFVDSAQFLHRQPIGSIEEQLDPRRYIRVHRSHIVRIDHIEAIRRTFQGASELIARDGERIPLGRKFAKAARAAFSSSHGRPDAAG